ncbi:glycine cleavage system transcriptional repressor [Endothiovibrio diazotrophicus]
MSKKWYMLTLVGEDRPGIVAKVAHALFEGGCNLGEASMARLGGSFTILMMVRPEDGALSVEEAVRPVAHSLGLHIHLDAMAGGLHRHIEPDVRITVHGADRAGIVAQVTGALAESGLNITDLESDVAGSEEKPVYVLHIEGVAGEGIEPLRSALETVKHGGIEASIYEIDTLIG